MEINDFYKGIKCYSDENAKLKEENIEQLDMMKRLLHNFIHSESTDAEEIDYAWIECQHLILKMESNKCKDGE